MLAKHWTIQAILTLLSYNLPRHKNVELPGHGALIEPRLFSS